MAIVLKPYTFSAGATVIASEHNSNFDTLYNLVNGGLDNANLSSSAAIKGSQLGTLDTIGAGAGIIPTINIETVAWADYFATSTIVGWTTPTGTIYTKKIGKTVFVNFLIQTASNSTTTTFTLPYPLSANPSEQDFIYMGYDNGGAWSPCRGFIHASTNIVNLTYNLTSDWTASGNKLVDGQFFYESA